MVLILGGALFVALLIYFANLIQAGRSQSSLFASALYVLVFGIVFFAINVFLLMSSPLSTESGTLVIPPVLGWLYVVLALVVAIVCIAIIQLRAARVFLRDVVIESQPRPVSKTASERIRFDPDSLVHTLAVVLALFYMMLTLFEFVSLGGMEGLAQSIAQQEPQISLLLLTVMIYVALALLGVGIGVRRTLPQVLARIGLQRPNRGDWLAGLSYGVGLYVFQIIIGAIWLSFSDPETLAQQNAAAEQVFALYSGSLAVGLVLAVTASIGEEIMFRGALQPVFGIWLTSLFFTILHTQYTLTPAAAIIFVVSAGFGWLRARRNTSAAIIAHFVYNALPFLGLALAQQVEASAKLLMHSLCF